MKFDSVKEMTLQKIQTVAFQTSLHHFPLYFPTRIGNELCVIGGLDDNQVLLVNQERPDLLALYQAIAKHYGYNETSKTFNSIELLQRCLIAGRLLMSSDDETINQDIIKLIHEFGIPNLKLFKDYDCIHLGTN